MGKPLESREEPSLRELIVRELWTLCDESGLTRSGSFFLLKSDGEVLHVNRSSSQAARTVAPALDWFVHGLREIAVLGDQAPILGTVVADEDVALGLRDFASTLFHKGTNP